MKKLILPAILLLITCAAAKSQSVKDLFQQKTNLSRDFHRVAGKYDALRLDKQALGRLRKETKTDLDLQFPFENQLLKLKLHKSKITADNFSVIEAGPGGARRTVTYAGPEFYQGTVEGKAKSMATITIFNDRVMGVISDEKGNIILGSVENKGSGTEEYALYRENNLTVPAPFTCGTSDIPVGDTDTTQSDHKTANRVEAAGQPVEIYFECDYKFYQDKGSNTNNVINYVLGFFNNTALLYANENIKMQISQILVWTTQDPEAAAGANTTSAVLTSFSTRIATTSFVGDYAHFLTTRSLGGGIAYIPSNPCASSKQYKTGVSAINNSYNDFPTYSWTVEVVTHELGHNLGSNHTQWCGWVGGPLDNCYTTEGGCAAGPAPTNGGTIMSYCHLTSYGINLSNGFGQQPGDKIRSVVTGAACFGTCKMTIAIAKVDASCGQNNGSATVTATNGTGAITYTWSNAQTGATLTNVGPGTYNVTVRDASGCQVMGVITIVNSGATLNATLTPSTPTSFCTGSSQTLTATNNAGYTYQWYKDAVLIGGASTNTYNANASGTYSVTISASGCSVSRSVVLTALPSPSATITAGGPLTFCGPGSVTLNGDAGTGYIYQWYNNGSAIGGATNATYNATTSGPYTVRVSAGTCQATSVATVVTANTTPPATITAGGATTFCAGGSVTLNANTGTGQSYQWYNNSSAISGATNSSLLVNSNGSYTVRVSLGSCQATSAATNVSVVSTPVANITAGGATTFCSGGHVLLNANTGTGLTYQWYNNSSAISGATNASYDVTSSGSYTVRVSAGSCQATSSATAVTVNSTPTATVTAGGATTFCSGGSVTLNANTGTGLSYQWYNNGTLISGATNASLTASNNGSYTVRVSLGSCQATSTATTVAVVSTPVANITAGGPTSFCSGGHVALNATTGTGYTYQWFNNGSAISGATNAMYDAVSSGSYTVRIAAGSCQATSTATVVNVSTTPSAVATASGPLTFCLGGNVMLNANTGTGLSYQWFKNGIIISGATNTSYTANASGDYTVRVSSGSCSSTSSPLTVNATSVPQATITAVGGLTFCAGGHVTLNANTGSGLTYQWYNNTSAISGATNASYDATASGSYTVRVSAGTCQTTSSATVISVTTPPSATITAGGPLTFCGGGNVLLNANTGSGLTYQWFINGSAINLATAGSFTAVSSGSYMVRVSSGNCSTNSAATVVVVNTVPTSTVIPSGPTDFCTEGSVDLFAATVTGYTYQWYKNGTAITNATNSQYQATTNGSFTVKITANGCQATSTAIPVTVSPAPDAVITYSGTPAFCAGTNLVLNANTGAGFIYQWYKENVPITGATNATYTTNTNGTYTVRIDLGTCYSTSTGVTTTVWSNPTVTVTPASSTIQKSQTQTLVASGAATYNWSAQPALVSSFASSAVVKPLTSTNYTIEGTDQHGCKGTAIANIVVVGCGDATNLLATSNSPARELVSWTNPAGVFADTLQYRKAGANTWTKIFVSGNSYEIAGLEPNTNYEYNIITLCNGVSSYLPSATATFKTRPLTSGVYLNLYPNPAITGPVKLEIITEKSFSMQATLYTNMGQQVTTISANATYPAGQVVKTIDVTGLKTGFYTVVLIIDGKKYNLKLLVIK